MFFPAKLCMSRKLLNMKEFEKLKSNSEDCGEEIDCDFRKF